MTLLIYFQVGLLVWTTMFQIVNGEVVTLTEDPNFKLNGYRTRTSYKLDNVRRFVIANNETSNGSPIEGLRLLYLNANRIEFRSPDVGESYFYRPTFYKFNESRMLIVCERGFEYSTGVDVFELNEGKVTRLGKIDMAVQESGELHSIVSNMDVNLDGDRFVFLFKGKIVMNPGGKQEKEIDGETVKGTYVKGLPEISLTIKSN